MDTNSESVTNKANKWILITNLFQIFELNVDIDSEFVANKANDGGYK
jgi:hypothetical protein